jgi:hypothetical protein
VPGFVNHLTEVLGAASFNGAPFVAETKLVVFVPEDAWSRLAPG